MHSLTWSTTVLVAPGTVGSRRAGGPAPSESQWPQQQADLLPASHTSLGAYDPAVASQPRQRHPMGGYCGQPEEVRKNRALRQGPRPEACQKTDRHRRGSDITHSGVRFCKARRMFLLCQGEACVGGVAVEGDDGRAGGEHWGGGGWRRCQMRRARWRLRQRIASRRLLPSACFRAR